jgi:hypothetical protein
MGRAKTMSQPNPPSNKVLSSENIDVVITEAPLSPEEQKRKLNRFFEIVLEADLKTFGTLKEEK